MATAMFGAGCFWGVEITFQQTNGVTATEVGYAGGHMQNPSYEDVCQKKTGHAEVVRVDFDEHTVSFDDLLTVFWENHNPTTLNQQGADFGDQYRSVIFYFNDAQKEVAEKSVEALKASGKWKNPIVTQIVEQNNYFKAEDYHQEYLVKQGFGTCQI
jgi:peptide-methionine (S)-S-oxide reductase